MCRRTRRCSSWLWILVAALMMASRLPCQAQLSDVYQLTYYAHNWTAIPFAAEFSPDQLVRIVNPGVNRVICADIFVLDGVPGGTALLTAMEECGACPISANGLLVLSLNENLGQAPLNFHRSDDGVIKIVSDNSLNCDPTAPVPTPNLRAWMSHVEGAAILNQAFDSSTLTQAELSFLGQACAFTQTLGGGIGSGARGSCTCSAAP